MIHFIPTLIISLIILLINPSISFPEAEPSYFTKYMLEWRQKSEIAQDYLNKAEENIKSGVKYKACLNQKLASQYGIEAFEALIKAQQYNDEDKELINIEESLNRWKELANCNTANSLFQ